MENEKINPKGSVLFIPHGGGPLPLLDDKSHQKLVKFLTEVPATLKQPSSILIISAHWEENNVTITSAENPALIYDYSGFAEQAYDIQYPAPGNPALAHKIYNLLQDNDIDATLDDQRGFDHGLFVPLKIMFPDASIPCVQISLVNSLDPQTHINIGKALHSLIKENILIIGSGFSFHNLRAFFSQSGNVVDTNNEAFEHWLIDTCTNNKLSESDRETRLINWTNAPFSRYCHPREEHLLPLHVCYGVSLSAAKLAFNDKVIGKKASAFVW